MKKRLMVPLSLVDKPLKIGLVLPADETDLGWAYMAVESGKLVKEKYGAEVSHTYFVTYADGPRIIRDYAAKGYDIVWAHGGEFEDAVHMIAPDFPKTIFVASNATKTPPPNVVGVFAKMHEGAYLAGVLSGYLTKTNALGYTVGEECLWNLRNANAFKDGALSVNSKVKVYRVVAGTWTNPAMGKKLALSLIDANKVDIIVQDADFTGRGVVEACKSRRALIIGTHANQMAIGPDVTVTSILMNTPAVMDAVVKAVIAGEFKEKFGGKIIRPGLAEGATGLAPYHGFEFKISEDIKEKIKKIQEDIIASKIKVVEKFERF